MANLVYKHILDVLHRDQVALRIHDGAFSATDLTARHSRTGELLSTVKCMVQILAAAGELQRELQRELTYDGLRAAEAKGSRRPAVPADKAADVRARTWRAAPSPPSPVTTRSAAAPSAQPSPTSCPTAPPPRRTPPPRSCRSPSTCPARSPTSSAPPNWSPLSGPRARPGVDRTARPGLHPARHRRPAVHRQLLARCQPLDGGQGAPAIPAQRKARREYENCVNTLGE
ncbi:hypothetical protein ACWD4O_48145 [Streptomyces sp. NPDC002623]